MITADQLTGSRRLYQLAEEARIERHQWRDRHIREELAWVAAQLSEAARLSLTADENWADAWAEAGVITIRKYAGMRRLIDHVT